MSLSRITAIFKKLSFLKPNSFGKDFIYLSICVILATCSLAVWLCIDIYRTESNHIIKAMEGQAERIDRSFMETMDYTSYIMAYLNDRVKEHGSGDLTYINNLYSSFRLNPSLNNHIPWNMFSWINSKDFLVVNSSRGILDEAIDVKERDYISLSKKEPDRLHFGKITYGKVSNEAIIPAAMGVYSKKNQYLGTTVFGFQVESLIGKIDNIINIDGISFAMVDEDLQILFESKSKMLSNTPEILKSLRHINFHHNNSGTLSKPHLLRTGFFSFYKIMPTLGYAIVISYDSKISNDRIFYSLLGRLAELFLLMSVSILSLLFLYRRIVRPMIYLSDVAVDLANGKTDIKIKNFKNSEAANLSSAMGKVKQLLANEKSLKNELVIAKDVAEEASAAKSNFLANMSHELRTPLNSIIGYSQMIHYKIVTSENYPEYIKHILSSGEHLLVLVDEILDISKAETGNFQIEEEEFNPEKMIKEIMPMLLERAVKHNIDLRLFIQEKLPIIFADPMRLKQIIVNLVSNAIKFSHKDGKVEIRIKADKSGFYIYVADEGIGMSPEDLAIKRFGHVNAMNRIKNKGSGLGLWLTKIMTEMHNGTISIVSELNMGTKVTIWLPAERIRWNKTDIVADKTPLSIAKK